MKSDPPEVRFWLRANKGAPDECWEWSGSRQTYGHGLLSVGRKNLKAHRFSYELHIGPIPDGLIVRHKCDNPPCVNPAHLEVGTRQDNNRDRDERGRQVAPAGEAHGMHKLTQRQVDRIRELADLGERKVNIARQFGICEGHVYAILRRKVWAN